MNFSIEIAGEERLQRELRGVMDDAGRAIQIAARPLSDEVYSFVRAQYASHGRRGPTGQAWTRKQATIDRYTAMNRRGFSVINEPGRRTDAAFKAQTTRGAAHGIYDASKPDELVMGDDLGYTKIRQDKGFKMYDPTDADMERLIKILKRAQKEKIADRGFDVTEDSSSNAIPF